MPYTVQNTLLHIAFLFSKRLYYNFFSFFFLQLGRAKGRCWRTQEGTGRLLAHPKPLQWNDWDTNLDGREISLVGVCRGSGCWSVECDYTATSLEHNWKRYRSATIQGNNYIIPILCYQNLLKVYLKPVYSFCLFSCSMRDSEAGFDNCP